jgi:ABC-type bacteriocin/lantibiotic exporter with double-glycine peptidase domain
LTQIHEHIPLNGTRHSFGEIRSCLEYLGIAHTAVRWSETAKPTIVSPTIIPLKSHPMSKHSHHFAILLPGIESEYRLLLGDGSMEIRAITVDQLHEIWNGLALHVASDTSIIAPIAASVRNQSIERIALATTVFALALSSALFAFSGKRLRLSEIPSPGLRP